MSQGAASGPFSLGCRLAHCPFREQRPADSLAHATTGHSLAVGQRYWEIYLSCKRPCLSARVSSVFHSHLENLD